MNATQIAILSLFATIGLGVSSWGISILISDNSPFLPWVGPSLVFAGMVVMFVGSVGIITVKVLRRRSTIEPASATKSSEFDDPAERVLGRPRLIPRPEPSTSPDLRIEVLRFLQEREDSGNAKGPEPDELAKVTGSSKHRVRGACDWLEARGYVRGAHTMGGDPVYWITNDGRAYLYELENETL